MYNFPKPFLLFFVYIVENYYLSWNYNKNLLYLYYVYKKYGLELIVDSENTVYRGDIGFNPGRSYYFKMHSKEGKKYDVEIRVIWYDEADPDNIHEKYEFVAYTADGRLLDDYPLPTKTRLSINRETGTAIDIYGNKYKIKFVA